MKATLEYNMPDDVQMFRHACKAEAYFEAINEIVQEFKDRIDYKEEDEARRAAFSDAKDLVFEICRSYNFSPWEDF
jgi:hypothetical protein